MKYNPKQSKSASAWLCDRKQMKTKVEEDDEKCINERVVLVTADKYLPLSDVAYNKTKFCTRQ
jgi:hypothetical protein